jgi:hypothetical protein
LADPHPLLGLNHVPGASKLAGCASEHPAGPDAIVLGKRTKNQEGQNRNQIVT